jgi:PAS domain S-box-containing protein
MTRNERTGGRRRPLHLYFAVPVAVFVLAAGAAALYVHVQGGRDARAEAERDARFAARTAARQLASDLGTLRTSLRGLAANPQVGRTFSEPQGCTLTYTGYGDRDRGHLDILRNDGRVVCSSRERSASGGLGSYAGAPWLARAREREVFVAPVRDPLTGKHVAVAAVPVPGRGVVAGFFDLESVGPHLASLYGGGRPVVFLIANRAGTRVIARSSHPERWIGTSLAGTEFAGSRGRVEHRDLEGDVRLYQQATVRGAGWRFHVGEDLDDVLATRGRLENRQLVIILVGLAGILLAAWLVYRGVARPIARLGAEVRSGAEQGAPRPVTVPSGGPAEIAALAEDVNALIASVDRELEERRRAEGALRRSEERYRLLFDRHPAPMWVFDPQSLRFLAVNDTAVATYGYTRHEFLSMTVEDIRPPEDRAALREAVDELADGRVQAGVWRHLRKDGSVIDVAITASAIELDGRPARVVLALDVTEQRRLEETLRQAQKMEAVGNLAGGIAHDVNNIVMVIRTCSALLLNRLDDPELRGDVTQIDTAAARAAGLTHQLLAFSRRQVLRPRVTDVNAVVDDILGLLQRLIGEDVEIASDLGGDVRPVVVDPSQLGQVLLNLAVNARDAMPTGGTLAIRTSNVVLDEAYVVEHVGVEPGPHVVLQVDDTGVGMDEETKSRIFDPFYTTKDAGTGLGLATVYGVVTQSGGHIWVYSEPGMGTSFKVYFPAAGAEPQPQPQPLEVTSLEGDETVLLVEDDPLLRPLMAESLRDLGYQVIDAGSGEDALRLCAAHESDIEVLVTDVVMPLMNGREVAERVRAARPEIRVLFSSGYPEDTILRHGIAEESAAYIEKPYLPDDLARAIRELLAAEPAI